MKVLLPVILALLGFGAGIGASIFLGGAVPSSEASAEGDVDPGIAKEKDEEKKGTSDKDKDEDADNASDYIKLNNQFVVPIIADGDVVSLVVLSLSLEVDPGNEEEIYEREPKVRDAFLRVLFDHANAGGFSGDFTQSTNMIVLRDSLLEIARKTLGDVVQSVLIIDLVRQDT